MSMSSRSCSAFTPELMEQVAPFVTVYSGQPGINVLAASPQVLAALPGMTPDRLYAILAQRQAPIPDLPAITALARAGAVLCYHGEQPVGPGECSRSV